MEYSRISSRWDLETLEGRVLLSLACEADLGSAAAKGGGRAAPAIQLDLVVLHELGHSLGLDHDTSDAVSIMDPYYNEHYNINYFLSGRNPSPPMPTGTLPAWPREAKKHGRGVVGVVAIPMA